MRLSLICVGRARRGPELALQQHYAERIKAWPLAIREVEERKKLTGAALASAEAALIRKAIPAGARLVALDERGKTMTSRGFAEILARWQEDGAADVAFVIGGAGGLETGLREEAALALAFGRATWPHQLVRAMLLEQLYRAQTILAGHPYHRE